MTTQERLEALEAALARVETRKAPIDHKHWGLVGVVAVLLATFVGLWSYSGIAPAVALPDLDSGGGGGGVSFLGELDYDDDGNPEVVSDGTNVDFDPNDDAQVTARLTTGVGGYKLTAVGASGNSYLSIDNTTGMTLLWDNQGIKGAGAGPIIQQKDSGDVTKFRQNADGYEFCLIPTAADTIGFDPDCDGTAETTMNSDGDVILPTGGFVGISGDTFLEVDASNVNIRSGNVVRAQFGDSTIVLDGGGGANEVTITAGRTDIVGALNIPNGASPPATCTVGDMFWDTDETDDTVIATTNDNALLFCGATDTWSVRIDS